MYVIIILMQVNDEKRKEKEEKTTNNGFNDENNERNFCVLIEINFHFGVCYKEQKTTKKKSIKMCVS